MSNDNSNKLELGTYGYVQRSYRKHKLEETVMYHIERGLTPREAVYQVQGITDTVRDALIEKFEKVFR